MPRKTVVDYRRLAADNSDCISLGVDALGTDFRALHLELLNYGGYRTSNARQLSAPQLTVEWLQQNGAFRPLLLPASPSAAKELGIALPEGNLTVERLASKVGLAFEVQTLDVQSQGEGPRWTLHQWCLYWEARRAASREPQSGPAALAANSAAAATAGGSAQQGARGAALPQPPPRPAEDEADSAAVKRKRNAEDEAAAQQLKGISAESKRRLLEVAALPLTGTSLEAEVSPPAAVCAVDLAQQVWPAGAPSRPAATVNLVMSPEGGYTDFHLAPAGASVWLHCLSGRRVLALVPPTPRNLATYAAWAASARHAGVFLPAHCEGVIRLQLGPGDTLIIPGGWAHAAATTSAAVLFGGTFLRRDALTVQLEAWRIEDHLGVRPRFRYPVFKQTMWYAAAAFLRRVRRLAGLSPAELGEQAAARLAAWAEEEAQEAAAKAQGAGSVGADSDSVSKAGAAKRKKGWLAGSMEVADDAGSKLPLHGRDGGTAAGAAGLRSLQMPGAASARPNASPAAMAGQRPSGSPAAVSRPRQIGRAVGGGSRLKLGGSGGNGVGSRGKARPLVNPTQLGIDVRRGGSGGGAGGGGFGRRKRERSPDSFIEKDSGDEGGDGFGGSEGEEDEVEWAPEAAAAVSGDEEMSDASEDLREGLDLAELAAAGAKRRRSHVTVMEVGEDGETRPRRLTARQAAREAAAAAAWDGRIAARQSAATAGGGWSEGDDELEVEVDDELGGWGEAGGGGGRRGRQSTRFGGRLPPRLAAMLQEEEGDELEEPAAAAPKEPTGAAAEAAMAAFAAAEQQQQQQQASVAPKPVKIRVRAPGTTLVAAGSSGEKAPLLPFMRAAVHAAAGPASGKLKIRIKAAAGGATADAAAQQQQQQEQQGPVIPQVDGAADGDSTATPQPAGRPSDKDQLQAMYEALYEEEGGQQQQAEDAAAPAQQLSAVLAAPLGQAGQTRAGARQPNPHQQQQQQQQHFQQQDQEAKVQQQGAAPHHADGDGGAAGSSRGRAGGREPSAGGRCGRQQQSASPQRLDSSQGQLAAGGEGGSVRAHRSAGSPSSSVEGPAAPTHHRGEAAEQVTAEGVQAASGSAKAAQVVGPACPAAQALPPAQQQLKQGHGQEVEAPAGGLVVSGGQQRAGSSGAAPQQRDPGDAPAEVAPNGAQQSQEQQQQHEQAPTAAAAAGAAADVLLSVESSAGVGEGEGSAPAAPLSLEEEEGLAALLAALKQWLRAPHALNDVPLTITNPKALVARLEVCMRSLGISLAPPPPVDFDSVPLDRLLPVRTPRACGTQGMQPSHQTPQTLGGSEFVPGELDAVGEEEGGEFDPDDLLEEGMRRGGGVVVEESAGPKHKLTAPTAAKPSMARSGASAGRAPATQPAKRGGKALSVKDRLKKKLKI